MSWTPLDKHYYPFWAPQPRESSSSYAMFRVYCFLQGDRSPQKVAEAHDRSLSNLKHLSSRWEWQERAAALDFHMQQFRMDGVRKAVEDRIELLEQRRLAAAEINLAPADQLLELCGRFVGQLEISFTQSEAGSRDEVGLAEKRTIVGCIDTLSRTASRLYRAGESVQTEAIINEPVFDLNPAWDVVQKIILEITPEIEEGIFN